MIKMCHRKRQEVFEKDHLCPYAMLVSQSKGRERIEEECEVRTAFQRDRDRILHSKAFRRMAHKTQVFISPEGDHYRTRLTHTLEVAQIARTLSRALKLNEDLTEAIALGHDLGHTPFGHTGERVLAELTQGEFSHNKHSLRVVEKLENNGKGLNLTYEVRDGILNHPTSGEPQTLEGRVVQIADKIAYINHDIDDAIRGRVLSQEDLPEAYRQVLGDTSSARINRIIMDIINESNNKPIIQMSGPVNEAFYGMRRFLFDKVYIGSLAKEQEEKAERVIQQLYAYYIEHLENLPSSIYHRLEQGDSNEQVVCDYIAGMTDRYAIHTFCDLFFPASWQVY